MSTTTETTTKAPEQIAAALGVSIEEAQARKDQFLKNIKKP